MISKGSVFLGPDSTVSLKTQQKTGDLHLRILVENGWSLQGDLDGGRL